MTSHRTIASTYLSTAVWGMQFQQTHRVRLESTSPLGWQLAVQRQAATPWFSYTICSRSRAFSWLLPTEPGERIYRKKGYMLALAIQYSWVFKTLCFLQILNWTRSLSGTLNSMHRVAKKPFPTLYWMGAQDHCFVERWTFQSSLKF